jgi:hypothetical protein
MLSQDYQSDFATTLPSPKNATSEMLGEEGDKLFVIEI